MDPNERRPGCRTLAFWCRQQAVALQHITDRLVAHLVPQIGQRPHDPVITPAMVLPGDANDQLLDLALDPSRPGLRRAFEPSNLRATSWRCQARIVSGRATVATSASALRPNRWPI